MIRMTVSAKLSDPRRKSDDLLVRDALPVKSRPMMLTCKWRLCNNAVQWTVGARIYGRVGLVIAGLEEGGDGGESVHNDDDMSGG
jgi:hypothetical protein